MTAREREPAADAPTHGDVAPHGRTAAASPVGNRALGALLAGDRDLVPRGAVVHPEIGAVIARRRMLQRWTREELLQAFRSAVAEGRWEDVALRLNGFNDADIRRLAASLSVKQLAATKAAVAEHLAGWPREQMILTALDAGARAKKAILRPVSSRIWAEYSKLSYAVWRGKAQRNEVWGFIGGSVGKAFQNQDTCAARVSYALDYGGAPISDGASFRNDPGTSFRGKAGDGKRYIVGSPALTKHLTKRWGPPDAHLTTGAQASAFETTLRDGQVAVFSGPHHAGLIRRFYEDPYVFSDPDVLPVDAWKLP